MLWIHNIQRGYSFWGKSISQQPLTDRTAPLTMYQFMHLTPYLSAVSFLNVSFKQLQCKSPITYFCLLLQHLICLISRNALPVPALNPEPFPHISNKKTTPPKKDCSCHGTMYLLDPRVGKTEISEYRRGYCRNVTDVWEMQPTDIVLPKEITLRFVIM